MTALKRLFGDGFRVFFLSAGVFAMLSMIVWELYLTIHALGGMFELPTAAPPLHTQALFPSSRLLRHA